ncbi:MAG: sterol desaturase family protein [Gemmatimonadaceae bacterium]
MTSLVRVGDDYGPAIAKQQLMKQRRKSLAGTLMGAAAFGALVWLEHRQSLRKPTQQTRRRIARNLAVAGVSAAFLQVAERPVSLPLARLVERRGYGLLPRLRLSPWMETLLGVLLMDYTLYLWHVLEHKIPALWRFHAVHHVDMDMDASTALRFHFGELAASIPWRAAQIALIGVTPQTLALYQRALMMSVIFHHSNIRLPFALEKHLARFIVTPRLHGIHHSVVERELHSNWSSGLTVWDRLHGTLRSQQPESADVLVGLVDYRDPAEVTLPRILAMPFSKPAPRIRTQSPRSLRDPLKFS